MKRHPALEDLSRDHHFVLRHTQRVRRAIAGDPRAPDVDSALRGILDFWEKEAKPHFDEEEEIQIPALVPHATADDNELIRRILADHRWLRERFAELTAAAERGGVDAGALGEAAARLEKHARLEEESLFERMQAAMPPEDLDSMVERVRRWRTTRRGEASVGPRESACGLD